MKERLGVIGGLACVLCATGLAADTNSIVAFGLNIAPTAGSKLVGNREWQVMAESPTNANPFGLRINLGEADTGVFGYPSTYFDTEEFSMSGTAIGSINGQTQQVISIVRGKRTGSGVFRVSAEFPGLGSGSQTFTLFNGQTKLAETTGAPGDGVQLDFYNTWWAGPPRVNPLWRMPDGSVGVLIEVDAASDILLPHADDDFDTHGNRVFIRANNPTNRVDYVSHVEVEAGPQMSSFTLAGARVGVFGRGHKALGGVTLHPQVGGLRVNNIGAASEVPELQDGILIELNESKAFAGPQVIEALGGASYFEARVNPVSLGATGAMVRVMPICVVNQNGAFNVADFAGGATIQNLNGALQLIANAANVSPRFSVYLNNRLAGAFGAVEGHVLAITGFPRIQTIGAFVNTLESPGGVRIQFDSPTTFTSDGTQIFGDEIIIFAYNGTAPMPVTSLENLCLTAALVDSLTIIGETEVATQIPRLTIARTPLGVTMSWPDPNNILQLFFAPNLFPGQWSTVSLPPLVNNFRCLNFSVGNESSRFFFLRPPIGIIID